MNGRGAVLAARVGVPSGDRQLDGVCVLCSVNVGGPTFI